MPRRCAHQPTAPENLREVENVGMNVLVLCDDQYHPAATPRTGLAPLAGDEFAFEFVEDGRDWPPRGIADVDVLLLTKANHISAEDTNPWIHDGVVQDLHDFVAGGKGLLVVHSGTVGYNDIPALYNLIGGGFVKHPPQCSVTVEPDAGHPLATGLASFAVHDEHYLMTPLVGDVEVFVTTQSEHGSQPGGWLRREGDGRVCVLTPGHNLPVWQHSTFQELLQRALRWCDGRGSKADVNA